MRKPLYLIILLLSLLTTRVAQAEIINGFVLLNGFPISAQYTVLSDGTLGLGTGYNACISQYSNGRVWVPPQITVSGGWNVVFPRDRTYKVTRVMDMAFRLCDNIRMVDVSEGVKRIGNFAFLGCRRLQELSLPSTLESIGTGAFIGLENLNYLTCKALTPPQWEYNDVFFFHDGGISDTEVKTNRQGVFLQVPPEALQAYKNSRFSDKAIGWITPEGWGTAFCNFNGSALEDYRVYDYRDLEDVRRISNNTAKYGNIKRLWIEADVEMNDTIWPEPIGAKASEPFTAEVNGQGHTLTKVKVESNDVAALIGYYSGPKVSGVRMERGVFKGGRIAASLVATATNDATIEKCYVVTDLQSSGLIASIVGQTAGTTVIDRCVANSYYVTPSGSKPLKAGIAGRMQAGTVTNCAVLSNISKSQNTHIFVGEAKESVSVNYCYSRSRDFTELSNDVNVKHGKNIILYGQKVSILDKGGYKRDLSYTDGPMQAPFAASVLGTKAWVYTMGEFPLPDCFVDRWPVRTNYAVYGSDSILGKASNILVPDEEIRPEDWLDLSSQGFRKHRFKASRLVIDDKLNVNDQGDHLPLGLAQQIVITNGVAHDMVLHADYMGKEDVILPVYQTDEEGNLLRDADGKPIKLGEQKGDERDVWQPHGYPISLPYAVTFSSNATLYQATRIYDINGQTTALFEPVRENRAEPFRPYYLVVRRDSVILGTEAKVVTPRCEDVASQLGNFIFFGSMSDNNDQARRINTYTLGDDGKWNRQKRPYDYGYAAIASYSAYFLAADNSIVADNGIAMQFGDDSPVISEGDFYFQLRQGNDGTYTATVTGYHGRGRNTVVPPTIDTSIQGMTKVVPVTHLGSDIFASTTAQLWSIDLSLCTQLEPLKVERSTKGNPFYRVSDNTIVYLPEGKAPAGNNVVVGKQCQSLTITDGWDFRPPYEFHADVAEYSRTLYATKKANGTYEPYAYTICLPFQIRGKDLDEAYHNDNVVVTLSELNYINVENGKKAFVFVPQRAEVNSEDIVYEAGSPSLVTINGGSYKFITHDTEVVATPSEDNYYKVFPYSSDADQIAGWWRGTFTRINNDDAADQGFYTLNGGKWQRIRSDEAKYRTAYVSTFRAFYQPEHDYGINTYTTDYVLEPQGDDDPDEAYVYKEFPSKAFDVDSDFSAYHDDDDPAGIELHTIDYQGNHRYFDIHGRLLREKPRQGLYIKNGKIMFAK